MCKETFKVRNKARHNQKECLLFSVPGGGGRHLAQQHEQRLQHGIGKSASHRRVLDDALDIVDENDAQRRLVTVREHLW